MKELFILILVVIGLWLLWFWFGGPQRYDPTGQGPFIKSPTENQYYYQNNNSEF
ncbi:MAG: hypothetical protein M3P22_00730 [bacterium]|nr:hypothetical protein [bacterium]